MTKARQKRPAYRPYVIPDLSKEPWRPFYPAHSKALDSWRTLNGLRKKPSPLGLSFQFWTFYNLRFLLAGDLAGCWAPFGGMSAQLTHLGLILNMAVLENATIAMTYAKQFRDQAAHLARQRASGSAKGHDRRLGSIPRGGGWRFGKERSSRDGPNNHDAKEVGQESNQKRPSSSREPGPKRKAKEGKRQGGTPFLAERLARPRLGG